MLSRLLAALLPLLLLFYPGQAQLLTVTGQVLNGQTDEPVPFAILGVRGKALGTAADEQGRFLLRLPPGLPDTLIVGCVGFEPLAVAAARLTATPQVLRLRPQQQALQEVTIRHRPVQPGQLGRSSPQAALHWLGGSSGQTTVEGEWGWEMGSLLIPARRTYLEEFHLYLADNKYERLRFRLNLYTVENNRPGRPLLSQDVQLLCTPGQKGWLTVDLRPYAIMLEAQPVAATIQWLQSEKQHPEDKYFSVPMLRQKLPGMVERENGQATWSVHNLQPSLYFTVLTEEAAGK